MYVIHLYDADFNNLHKYKAIGSLSQIKEDAKVTAGQRRAAHWHIYQGMSVVYQGEAA